MKYNFWKDAFKQPSVQQKICSYWEKAKNNSILTEQGINRFLDQKVDWISKSVNNSTPIERDCERYFPNSQCASQYAEKMALLKIYIRERLKWMNANLGADENECRATIGKIFSSQ